MPHNNKNNLIIQDNIRRVEIHYNGNEKQFDEFLRSIIKNYIFNHYFLTNKVYHKKKDSIQSPKKSFLIF